MTVLIHYQQRIEVNWAWFFDGITSVQLHNFFESIQLRDNVDAQIASSFYITSLSPLFGEFHSLGEQITMRERIQQLLDLILYGVEKK